LDGSFAVGFVVLVHFLFFSVLGRLADSKQGSLPMFSQQLVYL